MHEGGEERGRERILSEYLVLVSARWFRRLSLEWDSNFIILAANANCHINNISNNGCLPTTVKLLRSSCDIFRSTKKFISRLRLSFFWITRARTDMLREKKFKPSKKRTVLNKCPREGTFARAGRISFHRDRRFRAKNSRRLYARLIIVIRDQTDATRLLRVCVVIDD